MRTFIVDSDDDITIFAWASSELNSWANPSSVDFRV